MIEINGVSIYKLFEVVVSPSQVDSFLECPRKRAFKSEMRMPEPPKQNDPRTFGTVLHAVIERWLNAGNTGRDASGAVVDPFSILEPAVAEKQITRVEAVLIRKLVTVGYESGILVRKASRGVEDEYYCEVMPGAAITGKLDVIDDDGVTDHKSCGSRKYALDAEKLSQDPKMLCYAVEWFRRHPEADKCLLRLNYFEKNPEKPRAWPSEVYVTRAAVRDFEVNRLIPAVAAMLEQKRAKLKDEDWRKVAGPSHPSVCKKYGGCPYAPICGRMRTATSHRKIVEALQSPKPQKSLDKKRPVNKFFKKTSAAPAASATVIQKSATPPVKSADLTDAELLEQLEAEEAAEQAADEGEDAGIQPAPWAVPGCNACKDNPQPGFNSKGEPCRACGIVGARKGLPSANDFDIALNDDGTRTITPKGASKPVQTTTIVAEAKAKVETKPAPVVDAAPPAPEAAPVKEKRKPGRPKAAKVEPKQEAVVASPPAPEVIEEPSDSFADTPPLFTLCIGCVPVDEAHVDLIEVWNREGADLAQANDQESVYDMNPFDARKEIAKQAASIAESLRGQIVVCADRSPDLDALVVALRPYAKVIRAVR